MTTVLKIPEVVGIFHNVDALYAAMDELLKFGFSRSEISVLAGEKAVEEKLGTAFWKSEKLEDNPDAPRKSYIEEESFGAAEGGLIGTPMYVAAVVAAGALMTPAGSMIPAIVGATLAGGAGGALGGLLAHLVGRHHAQYLRNQIDHGGLLLWVRTPTREHRDRAVEIMKRHSGRDVHAHGWTTL